MTIISEIYLLCRSRNEIISLEYRVFNIFKRHIVYFGMLNISVYQAQYFIVWAAVFWSRECFCDTWLFAAVSVLNTIINRLNSDLQSTYEVCLSVLVYLFLCGLLKPCWAIYCPQTSFERFSFFHVAAVHPPFVSFTDTK